MAKRIKRLTPLWIPARSGRAASTGEDTMHRRHGNQVKVNGRCFAAAVGGVRLHRTLTRHPLKGTVATLR